MCAEVQDGMRREIFTQVAIEGREGMRRREPALEQEPHRIAFIAEGRLDADEHVAELTAEHMDGATIALLPAGGRAPLRLDLGEITLPRHVILDRDARVNVGIRSEAF